MMNRITILSAALIALCALSACKATEQKADPLQLIGRAWVAEDIDGGGVIDNSHSMIVFAANGRLQGHTGCNRLMGEVTLSGDSITIPATLAATRMACMAPAMADQERRFTEALPRAARWAVTNDLLYIYDAAGKPILRFYAEAEENAAPAE